METKDIKLKEARISLRFSNYEKDAIFELAKDLDMNTTEFIKAKVFGYDLTPNYIELIEGIIEDDDFEYENEPFTLKKILKEHWQYMSLGDRKHLVDEVLEMINDDEIALEVIKISKKGKVRFIKINSLSFARWSNFNFNINDNEF